MPVLNIEHIACNVSDAVAVAAWYVEHLGMRVVRKVTTAHMHFLADAAGHGVIEVYSNPADPCRIMRGCTRCVFTWRSGPTIRMGRRTR